MSNWKEFEEEEEEVILKWLISEIILQLKKQERPGESSFRYLTQIKLQKLIFLVSEDQRLDLTRAWYKYGGMIFAPFDIREEATSYYYRRKSLTRKELNFVRQILGNKSMNEISYHVQKLYPDIMYKKTDDFLDLFYEKKAPKKYQKKYEAFRSLIKSYNSLTSTQHTIDFFLQKLLSTFNPWIDINKFQKQVSIFHQEVAGICNEDVLGELIEFTNLMEKIAIKLTWTKYKKIKIDSNQTVIIKNFERSFNDSAWKFIASIIAIDTAKGTRANFIKQMFINQRDREGETLPSKRQEQEEILSECNLLPNNEILKEYFNSNYKSMFEQATGMESSQ